MFAALVWLVLGTVGALSIAPAEETPPSATVPASPTSLSADDISALCGRLGATDFTVREQATKQLIAGGRDVIEKVAAAAEVDNLEVAMRCLRILKELFQRPDEPTKAAAQSALQKLSASRNRSAARRAGDILNPPEVALPQGRQIMLRQMNVQVRVAAVNAARVEVAGGSRLQITNNNGNIMIDAEEGGRKVTITHQNEENIVVRVAEPPAAGEKEGKLTECKAKNLAELKEKHPEAHHLFERYSGAGALRRAGGGVPAPPAPAPNPPR